jgi:hypothetical protein
MRERTGRQWLQWVGLFGGLLCLLAGCDGSGGSSDTNGSSVIVIAAPTLSTIAPHSGPTTGGTAVTLTGTGFQAGATLTLGDTAATAVAVVSATQLTATTSPGPAGAQDVLVTNPDGQRAILAAGFTYIAPTLAPRSGSINGGTVVTLTGLGFAPGTTLTIGGTAATAVSVISATQLTATTPPGPAGAQDVVVTTPTGHSTTLSGGFTYVVPPPPTPSLYPGQLFAVFCLAVADVNDDGVPDLVGTSANDVVVLLGQGDGTFQAPQRVAVGSDPQDVAVADVNGDGVPDLVVANTGSNDVVVLLGQGDGTFGAPQRFATGTRPVAVAVADVNGDGHPDLVVANAGSNDVAVVLGQGDGTFQAPQRFVAGTSPSAMAVADVNGDDVPDLVVANRGDLAVSVLLHR